MKEIIRFIKFMFAMFAMATLTGFFAIAILVALINAFM